ncbi:MAG: hypothetical protein KGI42_03715 [Xanthomonadaceae bacterium]|nr:hypothetical protein [Xanthomonadaceae bacterium]
MIASWALMLALTQGCVMYATSAHSAIPLLDIPLTLEKFFGYFSFQPSTDNSWSLMVGELLFLTIIYFFLENARWKKIESYLIISCLCMAIISSVSRVSISDIHPALAGPRYFFFPYIFLSWILLQIAAEGQATMRMIAIMSLFGSIVIFTQVGQRHSDAMSWKENLLKCANATTFALPIQFDGRTENSWHVEVRGEDCKRLSGLTN